jgi:DNA mismatch endonuclease, patch repair protein
LNETLFDPYAYQEVSRGPGEEMVDVVDKATRSRMMGGIRAKNTRPEVDLRSALHRLGLRFRIHDRHLPGCPDIVFPKYRAAVQVHGCFWHRHEGCRFTTIPSSNFDFWQAKFEANVGRDRESQRNLEKQGWRIAIVWECAVRQRTPDKIATELANWVRSDENHLEIPDSGSTEEKKSQPSL